MTDPLPTRIRRVLRRSWRRWRDEGASRRGAGLAFYALFTLAPMLWLATWAIDPLSSLTLVDLRHEQLGALMPDAVIDTTDGLVTASSPDGSKRSLAIALIALLYAPLRGFLQLQATLNELWGVRSTRGPGAIEMVRRKGLAFASVGLTLVLLLAGAVVNGLLLAATERLAAAVAPPVPVLVATDLLTSWLLVFCMVVVLFLTLADVKIAVRPAAVGAAVTATLLLVGREAIAAYLRVTTRTVMFGAAGALVAVLLFAYWIAQVFLLGAAFTWALAEELGTPILPGPGAVARPAHPPA